MPSERYSMSALPLSLTKGITAIDWMVLSVFRERYELTTTAVVAAITAVAITTIAIPILRRFGFARAPVVAADGEGSTVLGPVERLISGEVEVCGRMLV